ncbi:hypothetical protein N1851_020366 [Merluccius polli]|uniref:Uncharacterized protein n=1 Tax=Merluccius polli TaxID=89951 RepID=A0AA47NX23_MERPO|nr:hypothetical protein N1851_020366 [Merluccius polli]
MIHSQAVSHPSSSVSDTVSMSISSSQLFLIWSPSSSGVPSISNDMSFALSSPTPLGLPPPTRVLSWAIFGIRSPEVPSPTPSPIALPVGESSGRTTSSRVLPSGSISAAAAATAAASASTATADTSAASPARTTATAVASPSRCPSWFSSARSPPLAFHSVFFVPCCVLPLSVILLVVVVFPWSVFLVDICSVPLSTFLVIVCAGPLSVAIKNRVFPPPMLIFLFTCDLKTPDQHHLTCVTSLYHVPVPSSDCFSTLFALDERLPLAWVSEESVGLQRSEAEIMKLLFILKRRHCPERLLQAFSGHDYLS